MLLRSQGMAPPSVLVLVSVEQSKVDRKLAFAAQCRAGSLLGKYLGTSALPNLFGTICSFLFST